MLNSLEVHWQEGRQAHQRHHRQHRGGIRRRDGAPAPQREGYDRVRNAQFLPKDNGRPPSIIASTSAATGILTTDFFGFDNSTNTYGLQGKSDLSEMGDAVLGMVARRIGTKAPAYVIVRNVSDPQIAAGTLTIREQEQIAAQIYKGFGRWSSVCSAIVCWAIVAGLQ